MDDVNFNKIKRELLTLCDAVSQSLCFSKLHAEGKQVALSVDYSLVAGYVRPKSGWSYSDQDLGFDRDIDEVGRKIFEYYPAFALSTPYHLVLSQPTVMEFGIANSRLAGEAHEILRSTSGLDALYDAFMRYVESQGVPGAIDDSTLFQRAKRAFETLNHALDPLALPKFLDQIKQGYIHGLGTYFKPTDYQLSKPCIQEKTKQIWTFLNDERRIRPSQDPTYHYFNNFVDAWNFAVSYCLDRVNNNVSLSYVAPYPPGLENDQIRAAVRHRSTPASLLLDLVARKSTSTTAEPAKEALDWLMTCFDRAKICKEYLDHADSVTELSDVRKREIQFFYHDYMNRTFGKGRLIVNQNDEFVKARALFADKRTFRERFEQAASLAQDTQSDLSP